MSELLDQETGKQLKPGDVVDVWWFTPRKPKGQTSEPPSRIFEGRQEWLETVWNKQVVLSAPWESTNDGLVTDLLGRHGIYCVNRMVLISTS